MRRDLLRVGDPKESVVRAEVPMLGRRRSRLETRAKEHSMCASRRVSLNPKATAKAKVSLAWSRDYVLDWDPCLLRGKVLREFHTHSVVYLACTSYRAPRSLYAIQS